jgi:hypothetical protein
VRVPRPPNAIERDGGFRLAPMAFDLEPTEAAIEALPELLPRGSTVALWRSLYTFVSLSWVAPIGPSEALAARGFSRSRY